MSILTENPLAIVLVGGLLTTVAAMAFLARRSGGALAALVGIVVATIALLLVERFVVTDREQVEDNLAAVLSAIEANDMPAVLTWIDPSSGVPADVQALMPLIKVEKARAMGTIDVEVHAALRPPTAVTSFRAFLDGVHTTSGMRVAYFNERVDVTWVKRGERWLIGGYTAYYEDRPIDAVNSARGNRPVLGR